ncbi:MAG TPA: methyltransferase domain-containing protein [Methylibium sp.]|uniref:class I SAM-dependent methyltransferase n=1 Tax=Methylibium sp. TaxID=2067992 RepID=UPI002DBFFCE0|nr:methyltransferase domain-containing protein [Methylibium sp.]HEU4458508.1 methyltransferase domain-containing protein [Methylibium sp.]
MDARLQRRVQRHGWDLASGGYQRLWGGQLAPAHRAVLAAAALAPGERVLDVACGSGQLSLAAAHAVGAGGWVLATDLAERMVDAARDRARALGLAGFDAARMDGEALTLADAGFDAVLCSLGLMYMPEPERALREAHRVLRPGGRFVAAVWGERSRCAWASVFGIVDAEVVSDVCPLFFRLGARDALARACTDAGFASVRLERIDITLDYASGAEACDAAFSGGPVALAWSRFSPQARERACERYLGSIEPWRLGARFRVPGEIVVVSAAKKEI